MTIENKITPVAIDGKDRVIGDDRYLIVQSSFDYGNRVVRLRLGKADVEVSAAALIAAVTNATNNPR